MPLAGVNPGNQRFQIAGRTYNSPDERPTADIRTASPKYFDTLGIPIKRGRGFVELDHEDARKVVVINEAMVRQWEGRDPIGAEIAFNAVDGEPVWRTIVGVSADVKQFGLDRDAVAQIYVPLRQSLGLGGRILVRTTDDPSRAISVIQDAVRTVDPDIPIENFRTMDELRDRFLATPKLTAGLLTVFAGLALLVTLTGITGVIAQSVSLACLGPAWRATRVDPMTALRAE